MKERKQQQIIIYKEKNQPQIKVSLIDDTVWLTQAQIAQLFDVNVPAISKHIKNIYKDKELNTESTVSKMETVQTEGGRQIKRQVDFYNLDMIISIGYRVNSRRATNFRIWATKTLRNHILKGYTINEKRLKENKQLKLKELQKAISLMNRVAHDKLLSSDETRGILHIISSYTNSWVLLEQYDKGKLKIKKSKQGKIFTYEKILTDIALLKKDLLNRKQASDLFGREREKSLQSILGNLRQTFGGKELYSSIEEKAAHLLYFVIKDHPFVDGNKRIACFLFILFLTENNYLLNKKGEKKINDNALVALALLIAESQPKEKDTMIALTTNLLYGK